MLLLSISNTICGVTNFRLVFLYCVARWCLVHQSGQVNFPGSQYILNCFWHSLSLSQWDCMSIAFVHFGYILPLHTVSAIALSVCNQVGGYLCLISFSTILMYTASRAMMYIAASSASSADVMTCLIMWVMLRIAPFFCGIVSFFDKKEVTACLIS